MRASLVLLTACLTASLVPIPAYPQFPLAIDLADSTADVEIYGPSSWSTTGWSSAVGDINGDGLPDLVIGSCLSEPLAGQRKGEVHIVWGGGHLQNPGLIDLAGQTTGVSRIFGRPGDNPFFCRLATGDFNNDGCDDIVFGEPYGPNIWADGRAYVILGNRDFPDTLDLVDNPENVFSINGGPWGGFLGRGLCACDLNGDGYDDIVVSAPAMAYGEVYVIQGADSFEAVYDLAGTPAGVVRIIDNNFEQHTGMAFACTDIDEDGYNDLIIGSPGGNISTNYAGIVTVLYGEATLPDTILLSATSFRTKVILPEYVDGNLGYSVAAGDVNNDGRVDLVISAFLGDPLGCFDCGEVYLIYDADSLPDTTRVSSETASMTRILGEGSSTWYGVQVLCGDVSADGIDDVVITSFGDDSNQQSIDKTIVVYGSQSLPDSIFLATDTLVTRIYAANPEDYLGMSLVSGDFNGDDASDLVLGADFADPLGRQNAGTVYLLYGIGIPTGIDPPRAGPSLVLKQNYPNPFSSATRIEYELPAPSAVTITIYNILGQRVAEIHRPTQPMGRQTVTWNGRDASGRRVASGIYFYQVKTAGLSQTKKMLLLR